MKDANNKPQHYSDYQFEIYSGLHGTPPSIPVSAEELEAAAKKKLRREAYDYIEGGAGAESTIQANLRAFEQWSIVPRMLRDVSHRDYQKNLFGTTLLAPMALAPIGQMAHVCEDAELACARAAAQVGLPYTLSTVSSATFEDIAEVEGLSKWYQLYWPNDDDLLGSFLQRAEKAGFEAVMVTLDTALLGWRERDLQNVFFPGTNGIGLSNYFTDPVFQKRLGLTKPPATEKEIQAAFTEWTQVFSKPNWTWDDLEAIQSRTKLPVILKGIQHPEDAQKAIEAKVQGIVVSNHGGRQVDGAIGALEALPQVAKAIDGRIPVLFDSGIRRGADIVKALALGADAILIGRPYVWGLALEGAKGVESVLRRLLAEFDLTMALSGFRSTKDLSPSVLHPAR